MRRASVILTFSLLLAAPTLRAADTFSIPQTTSSLLSQYCTSCHGPKKQKAKIRLDTIHKLNPVDRTSLLNKIQEQLHLNEMPPEEKKQPTPAQKKQLTQWVNAALQNTGTSTLAQKLRKPGYGNYVNHEKLFSGEYAYLKPFTYDRRWLISEFIFDAKFNRILNHRPNRNIDGKRRSVIGDNNRRVNLTNPFLLPTNTGVRYFDNTTLNGGHLLTMITNAREAAAYMMHLTGRDRRYLPAVNAVMAMETQHNTTLASRQKFLNNFIDRILNDIYKEKHHTLLPTFTRVKIKSPKPTNGKPIKKAPFHAAQPGREELVIIFNAMRKHKTDGDTDAQLIEKCEREWFYFGHNERKIQARVTFLKGYMTEWRKQITAHRYAQRHRELTYRPLKSTEMQIVTEAILRHRKKDDRYITIINKCMTEWENEFKQQRIKVGPPDATLIKPLVNQLFIKILERQPTPPEAEKYALLAKSYFQSLGNRAAIQKLIQTLILRSDFVYRYEFGHGKPDPYGRKRLTPRDAAYAIAYALTDSSPDQQLLAAANTGKLQTREDYKREVLRILKNREQYYIIDEGVQRLQLTASITNTPIRKLRFFREFFGYPKMLAIFKDNKRFGGDYDKAKGRLVGEADRLVDHIIQNDKNVFEQLLTTENFYVYHSGDNVAMKASSDRIRKIYEYFKDKPWQDFQAADLLKHKDFLLKVKMRGVNVNNLVSRGRRNSLREFKTAMTSFTKRFDKGQTAAAPFDSFPAHGKSNADTRLGQQLRSPQVAWFYNIQLDNWNYPATQPAKVANRRGMLTHPAWLIAHAQNTENDPVRRGKWIREKLLAGTIPDLPITVEAVIPEDHHKTLRQRMENTTAREYCWRCHKKMEPLGLPFEIFDDFGRYRTSEPLEHPDNIIKKGPGRASDYINNRDTYKTLPVNAKGDLSGTGNPRLDGPVQNALELTRRLAKSKRVRQSIIRHAFRYFMGRNEMLSDSKTLIDADQAYVKSGGSFDAVIVSLLTSDSFIYRKSPGN